MRSIASYTAKPALAPRTHGSDLGGEALQMNLNLPLAITGVFQGLLLFFVLAADVLIRYRIRLMRPARG